MSISFKINIKIKIKKKKKIQDLFFYINMEDYIWTLMQFGFETQV